VEHEPGADALYIGNDTVYNWMRVKAGGGQSMFSSVKMLGPLVDANNSPIISPYQATQLYKTAAGINDNVVFGGVQTEHQLNQLTANAQVLFTGGLTEPLPFTNFGCRNTTGASIIYAKVDVTVNFEVTVLPVPTTLVNLVLKNNGIRDTTSQPQISVNGTGFYQISGTFLILGLNDGNELLAFIESTDVSVDVKSVTFSCIRVN
jgi:hypothetical protein